MDTTDIDQLADKFGGRYKLTVLIQKRLKELVKGGQKLVDVEDRNLISIVLEEIRNGKVALEDLKLEEAAKEEGRTKARKKER